MPELVKKENVYILIQPEQYMLLFFQLQGHTIMSSTPTIPTARCTLTLQNV